MTFDRRDARPFGRFGCNLYGSTYRRACKIAASWGNLVLDTTNHSVYMLHSPQVDYCLVKKFLKCDQSLVLGKRCHEENMASRSPLHVCLQMTMN